MFEQLLVFKQNIVKHWIEISESMLNEIYMVFLIDDCFIGTSRYPRRNRKPGTIGTGRTTGTARDPGEHRRTGTQG